MQLNSILERGSKQARGGAWGYELRKNGRSALRAYDAASTNDWLLLGNAELLETTVTCPQIFSRRGGPNGKVAEQFHASIPRGIVPRKQRNAM